MEAETARQRARWSASRSSDEPEILELQEQARLASPPVTPRLPARSLASSFDSPVESEYRGNAGCCGGRHSQASYPMCLPCNEWFLDNIGRRRCDTGAQVLAYRRGILDYRRRTGQRWTPSQIDHEYGYAFEWPPPGFSPSHTEPHWLPSTPPLDRAYYADMAAPRHAAKLRQEVSFGSPSGAPWQCEACALGVCIECID